MKRKFGVILPVYSIPSEHGIGSFGKEAFDFIDFLYECGAGIWQVLPLGPTGYGNSPYQCFSAFAGNDYFIDLEKLVEEGLLKRDEIKEEKSDNADFVDYGKIYSSRYGILDKAAERFFEDIPDDYDVFMRSSPWVIDYAVYMSVKRSFNMTAWTEWPVEFRDRDKDAIDAFVSENDKLLRHHYFCQYEFFKQWNEIVRYAHNREIEILGDMPIYVSMDSADVWSNRDLFLLDEKGFPISVAGVPPDYFSETGQLWGNPIYRWDDKREKVYEWWGSRIKNSAKLFDYLRIDHFRGFDSYWVIPYGEETAVNGEWVEGPGIEFIRYLKGCCGNMKLIAEDLGILTPSVKKLLKDSGLPGMKVLEFAFSSGEDNEYLPENYPVNCVCYTGTHDNDPVIPWLDALDKESEIFFKRYMESRDLTPDEEGMVRLGMSSRARFFIVQMQDILKAGSMSRTNRPGEDSDNWMWRLRKNDLSGELASKVREVVTEYDRI